MTSIRNKQIIIAALVITFFTVIVGFVLYQMRPKLVPAQVSDEKDNYKQQIESVGQKIDSEAAWRYNQNDKIRNLQESISSIKADLERGLSKEKEIQQDAKSDEIESLRQEILMLRSMISDIADAKGSQVQQIEQQEKINRIKISLSNKDDIWKTKNKDDTVPAGSFAKAVLLGGVDASTALSSPSDPRPMLIRLVDLGTLPRKFQSDLKDCHVIASGYGDLSSERVFARLEKLTCIERNSGEIIEKGVSGYIAGEDGRAGIRGYVVEKGRGYLAKSVVGGVLQGLAGVFSPDRNQVVGSVNAFIPRRNAGEKFNEGALTGANDSMDRLSKYYIERAESIQPVIQVASGRTVDVVFTEGFDIGTAETKAKPLKTEKNAVSQNNEEKDVW